MHEKKHTLGDTTQGERWVRSLSKIIGRAEDHYRRCFSKDNITVPRDISECIPTSNGDPVGYIGVPEDRMGSSLVNLGRTIGIDPAKGDSYTMKDLIAMTTPSDKLKKNCDNCVYSATIKGNNNDCRTNRKSENGYDGLCTSDHYEGWAPVASKKNKTRMA